MCIKTAPLVEPDSPAAAVEEAEGVMAVQVSN
jgi:hypothetical protein